MNRLALTHTNIIHNTVLCISTNLNYDFVHKLVITLSFQLAKC